MQFNFNLTKIASLGQGENWRLLRSSIRSIKQWTLTSRQFKNRPSPPLHPSTLYPLHSFPRVNPDPLLSWINNPYLREQRPSQRVLYVPPCVMWRGNVSPTCVRILADPNLLSINQNTCLECALCQQLACRPDGLPLPEPFVSPLESSVLCQINSICPRDWFQNANVAREGT